MSHLPHHRRHHRPRYPLGSRGHHHQSHTATSANPQAHSYPRSHPHSPLCPRVHRHILRPLAAWEVPMGLGSEASAGGGAGFSAAGDYPSEGSAPLAGSGASPRGGVMDLISKFFKEPKNVQALGEITKAAGNLQEKFSKLPPEAQQFTHEMISSLGAGGGRLGAMDTSRSGGAYTGDIDSYRIDPETARLI